MTRTPALLVFTLVLTVAPMASALAQPAPTLAPAPYAQTALALASNGTDFVVLSQDARATEDLPPYPMNLARGLYATHLGLDGQPEDPRGIRLYSITYGAKLAPRGTGYLLTFQDDGGLFTEPLNAVGGHIGSPATFLGSHLGSPLALGTNGTAYLLLTATHALILDGGGRRLHDTPIADEKSISPIWTLPDGSFQFAAFRFYCNGVTPCIARVVLTTVSPDGALTESGLVDLPQQTNVAAGFGGGRIAVASETDTGFDRSVEVRLFDTNGTPLHAAVRIDGQSGGVQCTCYSNAPSVGYDGRQFLIAYQWPSGGAATELRALRMTADGVAVDAAPFVVDPSAVSAPLFASSALATTMAWASGTYATSDLVARTFRSFDEVATTATSVVSTTLPLQRNVRVAAGPLGTLEVWREGYPSSMIEAALAGQNPVTLSPPGALDQQAPAVARGRNAFLVVWREAASDIFDRIGPSRILGKRVGFDGLPIDAAPFVIATDAGLTYAPSHPDLAVASNGTDWLVVYPGQEVSVRAVRVAGSGAVLDPTPIVVSVKEAFGIPGSPRVAWSGTNYVVAWSEDPHNPIILSPPGPPASLIYEASVTPSGELVGKKANLIWHGGFGSALALAPGAERFLLAWTVDSDIATQRSSVYTMILGLDGSPAGGPSEIANRPTGSWPTSLADLDAAWDGASFVVAWTDRTPNFTFIRYAHVDRNGARIEAAPVDFGPEGVDKVSPALAPSAEGVFVAYHMRGSDDVARVFTGTIDRLRPFRRRVAGR